MKFKQLLGGALATALALSVSVMPTLAAGNAPAEDGAYTADLTMLNYKTVNDETPRPSMSANVFFAEADIVIEGDDATVTIYALNPLPAFPDMGPSLGDTAVTYQDTVYSASYDTTIVEQKVSPVADSLFGLTVGETYDYSAYTMTYPKAALDESYLYFTSFVDAMGGGMVELGMVLSGFQAVEPPVDTRSMAIDAVVAKNTSVATITIPESTSLGTLNIEGNTVTNYTVTAKIGSSGKTITVSTADGALVSEDGDRSIPVENKFGVDGATEHTFDADGSRTGRLVVSASDVIAATTNVDQTFTGAIHFTITVA